MPGSVPFCNSTARRQSSPRDSAASALIFSRSHAKEQAIAYVILEGE
jgi:hypothetical protein